MEIVILGDTHVPSRADGVPDWVCEAVRDADHAIHTGDFDSAETLATVRDLARGTT